MIRKFLGAVLNPQKLVFKSWAKTGMGSYKLRLDYDVFSRPHYAFSVYHGALLAKRLNLKRVSMLEFGVAGGGGLIEMERLAALAEKEHGVKIDIYGFDTGEGLPAPVDYRDLPYIWKEGFYKMDQESLKSKLHGAQLVLGDVRETVPTFIEKYNPAPIAAIAFDLDFWSSTLDSFKIFDAPPEKLLPRIFCYCDDVLSAEGGGLLNEYVGQLAAIRDYNAQSDARKLAPIHGFNHTRRISAAWNDKMYVHHSFDHPSYNTYVHADANRQLQI